MTDATRMTDLHQVREFVLAGDALFTLVSRTTGKRLTLKVEKAKSRTPTAAVATEFTRPGFFVRMLVGPENTSDYRYLGFLHERGDGALTFKLNKTAWGADSGRAVEWLVTQLNAHEAALVRQVGEERQRIAARFEEQAEFWHAGRCGRCGRTLTDPESIARGIGPTCAGRE